MHILLFVITLFKQLLMFEHSVILLNNILVFV